jgi:toxin ParE1/3/4
MPKLLVSPQACEDLDQIHCYLFHRDPEAADRVLEAALTTFEDLAETPGMGRPRVFQHAELSGLRSFRVRGFPNYLIFYRAVADGIEIVRVLHAARDLDALFGDD